MKLSLRRYGSSKFWSPISSAKAASSPSSRSIERSSASLTGTMRVELPISRASWRTSTR